MFVLARLSGATSPGHYNTTRRAGIDTHQRNTARGAYLQADLRPAAGQRGGQLTAGAAGGM